MREREIQKDTESREERNACQGLSFLLIRPGYIAVLKLTEILQFFMTNNSLPSSPSPPSCSSYFYMTFMTLETKIVLTNMTVPSLTT